MTAIIGISGENMRGGIWRAASLMREARGPKAAEEAAVRALSYRSRGDEAGFDVWSLVFLAIRALEALEASPKKLAPSTRTGTLAGGRMLTLAG